jgi:hypothetical protein
VPVAEGPFVHLPWLAAAAAPSSSEWMSRLDLSIMLDEGDVSAKKYIRMSDSPIDLRKLENGAQDRAEILILIVKMAENYYIFQSVF